MTHAVSYLELVPFTNDVSTNCACHTEPPPGSVRAVTSLNNDVFVLRKSKQQNAIRDVEIYDATTMKWKRNLAVPDKCRQQLEQRTVDNGCMATCGVYNCLYLGLKQANSHSYIIHRIQMDCPEKAGRCWPVTGDTRLSVNSAHHLLIVGFDRGSSIHEYTTYGIPVRKITIADGIISTLVHAVELDNTGQLAVSHSEPFNGVSITEADGRLIESIAEYKDDSTVSDVVPVKCLAVARQCGRVLAASGDRVLIVDRPNGSAVFARVLCVHVAGEFHDVIDLCLDESRDRLYIADSCGGGRVLAIDNVSSVI